MDYKEKVRLAKEALESGSYDKETIEYIFPELKESEDERIRKALIGGLKNCVYSEWHNGVSIKECIAWLEKQGEHAKFRDSIQVGDKVTRNQDGVLVNLSQLNRVAKKDEKQGEQKPAKEWTIYDAKTGDVLNSVRVQATIIFKGFANDDKHIIAYCALQKGIFIKQEMLWDRDFEPASEYWKNALYDAMIKEGYDWDADELKLTKSEQKHAEWNKNDKVLLDETLHFIREFQQSDRCVDEGDLQNSVTCENWLKSIKDRIQHQTTWKPSYVQMEVLLSEVTALTEGCNKQIVLKSLYNDLRKLKG